MGKEKEMERWDIVLEILGFKMLEVRLFWMTVSLRRGVRVGW